MGGLILKALIVDKPGSINGLNISLNIPLPEPKDNEVRICVKATGLNPSDFQTIEYMTEADQNHPTILGLDVAGIIDKTGSKAADFKVGDRVVYLRDINNRYGGFAEYALSNVNCLVRIPENISFADAATLPSAGFTAFKAIEQKLRPTPDKTILIHGGAGGVGSFAIQLAKRKGTTVIATCSEHNKEYVLSLGADIAIDYKNENVYEFIRRYTCNEGVDYIISSINPEIATQDLDILAFDGEIACLVSFPNFSKIEFYEKELSIHEIALGILVSKNTKTQKSVQFIGEQLMALLSSHQIKVPKTELISLEQVPEKLKEMKQGKNTGKIIAIL